MRLLPIRYVRDVPACTAFYRALGLAPGDASRPGVWVELPAASGTLALHGTRDDDEAGDGDGAGTCELAFESEEPLEAVRDRLLAAGFAPEPVVDEAFGRSMRVSDPDGVVVQVNEHDRELYT